jgi:hypothetical protein
MTKEVLKQALAALALNNAEWKALADSCDRVWWTAEEQYHYIQTEKAIAAIKEALAQPEQEPVAWMTINGYGEEDDIHYEHPKGHLMEGWTYKPLYTHPPQPVQEPIHQWRQRQWRGLTDKEFEEIIMSAPNAIVPVVLWQLIQDKIKEKNIG